MQSVPSVSEMEREERKMKGRFYESLMHFMKSKGLEDILEKVIETSAGFIFEHVLFKNEEHKCKFFMTCGRYAEMTGIKTDNIKTAVIYLLSANRFFYPFLERYISVPGSKLGRKIKGSVDEEVYNLYHAAREIAGLKSGLRLSDLTEDGIIADKTVCLIVNAMYLKEYGLSCGNEDWAESPKIKYKNTSKSKSRTYSYKDQTVRIK